jgi:hypothetical protein
LVLEKDALRFGRLRKNVGVAAKLHNMNATPRGNVCMVTLTYADAHGWGPRHVADYLRHVRNWFKRLTGRSVAYVWVAEMQAKRSTPTIHYHVVFWLPKGVTMPKADKRGWWPHGMTNTKRATAPVAYVMKYASKFDSKKGLPHGARIYGVGGLDAPCRNVRRWVNWPAFVQARAAVTDSFAPQVGGGWVNRATGEWWPSEYGLSFSTPLHSVVVRLHDHGRPMAHVAGPFNWIPNTGGTAAPAYLH